MTRPSSTAWQGLCLSLCLGLCAPLAQARAPLVRACANQAEMPPFTFVERGNGRIDGSANGKLTGVTVDMLGKIARQHGWQLSVQLMPWLRCLAFVAEGKFQLALDVDRADAGALALSRSYFTVHSMYFYSSRVHPRGLGLQALDQLARHKICGLLGRRFEAYGIDTDKVDLGTTSYEQLIGKLHRGRCDLFIENRETLAGLYLLNPKLADMLTDPTLHSEPVPGLAARELRIAVAPGEGALLRQLDEGLARLLAQGEVDKLLANYLQ
ncbi:MAG: transporter substrate-binding domain-containing protein [Pseudomonadota bacterium]